jgi:hypothetical protein
MTGIDDAQSLAVQGVNTIEELEAAHTRVLGDQDFYRAFESKFAHDEEMRFRVIARRNRLLGAWAARLMGLSEAEADAYAKDVIRADFEEAGEEDVIRKLLGDLTAAGVETDEAKIREALAHKEVEARRQVIDQINL